MPSSTSRSRALSVAGLFRRVAVAPVRVPAQRLLDHVDQFVVVDRLAQEIARAALERTPARIDVAMAGQHDHRQATPAGETIERVEPAHPRHPQVEQHAAERAVVGFREKRVRIGETAGAQADGPQQQREAVAHGFVVVDDRDDGPGLRRMHGFMRAHPCPSRAIGSNSTASAPPDGRFRMVSAPS